MQSMLCSTTISKLRPCRHDLKTYHDMRIATNSTHEGAEIKRSNALYHRHLPVERSVWVRMSGTAMEMHTTRMGMAMAEIGVPLRHDDTMIDDLCHL